MSIEKIKFYEEKMTEPAFLLTENEYELLEEALSVYLNQQNDGRGNTLLNRQSGRLLAKLSEVTDKPKATYQEMVDAGYEMTADGIWWPKDTGEEIPDYSSPAVCAKIDMLAGDNRN
tara:strand:- start:1133 stop:1483 length:351 start_codon:yes stop_codon:yes gene_type:complete